MTANDVYAVAGSASGSSGHTGNGGAATSALLSAPAGVSLDAPGDLYVADTTNNRIQEVPIASGTQWGQSMTANDIYTTVGSASGSSGSSGDGGAATSALLSGSAGDNLRKLLQSQLESSIKAELEHLLHTYKASYLNGQCAQDGAAIT